MIHVTQYTEKRVSCDICGKIGDKKFRVTNDRDEEGYIMCEECKNLYFPKER